MKIHHFDAIYQESWGFCMGELLVAGTVPWSLCFFLQENRCPGWWVGWGGDDDVLCTCTHVTCYSTDGVGRVGG